MHAANDATYLLKLRIFNLISFPPIPCALIVYRSFGAKRTRVYRTAVAFSRWISWKEVGRSCIPVYKYCLICGFDIRVPIAAYFTSHQL